MNPVDLKLCQYVQERPELYDYTCKDIKNYVLRAASFQTIDGLLSVDFPDANFNPGS